MRPATKLVKLWTPLTILLVVIIALSGIFAWSRYQVTQAKEISIADTCPSEQYLGEIYIGGAVANPELAIISVGSNNEYGHPSPEVIARLIEKVGSEIIYRTDEHGTIEFITDGERLWVRTEQ